ncbi:MAG: hypothetical protein KKH98_07380 [Spirochaetes bacterium]|nr:hypothetical protein [Spirochaetota bacterium]
MSRVNKSIKEWPWFVDWKWVMVLAFLSLSSYFFAVYPCFLGSYVYKVLPLIKPCQWGKLIAIYMAGIALSHIVIHFTLIGTRFLFKMDQPIEFKPHMLWPAILVGFCEAGLYPTAWIIKQPDFIAIWLIIKTAGQWDYWKDRKIGRMRFNMFLIGNALMIGFGYIIYKLIKIWVLP